MNDDAMSTSDDLKADSKGPPYIHDHHIHDYLVGGCSHVDAAAFLSRCGILDDRLRGAVLRVCVDEKASHVGEEASYDECSLELCADIITQERVHGKTFDPQSFDMPPGDFDQLVQRFVKALADGAQAEWLTRLSLPFHFDEAAARQSFSPDSGAARDLAWAYLDSYSFTSEPDAQGWRTLHPRMREALCKRLTDPYRPGDVQAVHADWRSYWQSRTQADTDDCAQLAWYHRWFLEPDAALLEWTALANQARKIGRPDMSLHFRLLDWWRPIELDGMSLPDVAALYSIGVELIRATPGDRTENLNRAIACFEGALQVYTEDAFAAQRASAHHSLALAYSSLPTGNIAESLNRAILYNKLALRYRTETECPQQWADTEVNLATAYTRLPTGDRGANLKLAIASYEAASRVFTESGYPEEWALVENNLAIIYTNLPTGNRCENVKRGISKLIATLRVSSEDHLSELWAATQINLGAAYAACPSEDRQNDIRLAISSYEAALTVYTESAFPEKWAITQNNLGTVYFKLPAGDRNENAVCAIARFEAALRVATEDHFPRLWAMTQNNLAGAYLNSPSEHPDENVKRAIAGYESTLRVYTQTAFPRDWATTKYNQALLYQKLATEDADGDLKRAIDLYDMALQVTTEANYPLQWANIQNNLALAYLNIKTGERPVNLKRAISYLEAAIRYYSENPDADKMSVLRSILADTRKEQTELPGPVRRFFSEYWTSTVDFLSGFFSA